MFQTITATHCFHVRSAVSFARSIADNLKITPDRRAVRIEVHTAPAAEDQSINGLAEPVSLSYCEGVRARHGTAGLPYRSLGGCF
jgi:hypothetical protein